MRGRGDDGGAPGRYVWTITRPGALAAPCPARDLREQLERPLGRAEVGQVEPGIGAQHADERDAGEVVALRHHLRADEDVDLATRDARQHGLGLRAARDVAIEPRDARLRKLERDRLRDLLGAEAFAHDRVVRLALRAALRHALDLAAVVADQPIVRAVVRQRHRAVACSGTNGRTRGTSRTSRSRAG